MAHTKQIEAVNNYLNAIWSMTLWTQKECAINEWIAIENKHRIFAQNTIDFALVMLSQRG